MRTLPKLTIYSCIVLDLFLHLNVSSSLQSLSLQKSQSTPELYILVYVQPKGGLLPPFSQVFSKQFTGVFVVVAVDAEVFPIRPVGRIVQVISVFVMNRQEMSRLFIKLSPTLGADEAMNLERAFSIITPWRFGLFQFLKGFFNGLIVTRFLRWSFVMDSIGFVSHKRFFPSPFLSPCTGEREQEK